MQRPLIKKTLHDLEEKRKDQSIEAAERRREERSKFLHREIIHRIRNAKTHKFRGDDGIAKMLEVGFKSTSKIQATRVSANAGAAALSTATNQLYAKRLYLPDWRREVIEELKNGDEPNDGGSKVPNGT